jgi:hypothetical protein
MTTGSKRTGKDSSQENLVRTGNRRSTNSDREKGPRSRIAVNSKRDKQETEIQQRDSKRLLKIRLNIAPKHNDNDMIIKDVFDMIKNGKSDEAIQSIKQNQLDVNTCHSTKLESGEVVEKNLLHTACYHGRNEIINALIGELGGQLETTDKTFKGTALGWSAFGHQFETCERLIFVYGSKIGVKNIYGNGCIDLVPNNERWNELLRVEGNEEAHKIKYLLSRLKELEDDKFENVKRIFDTIKVSENLNTYKDGLIPLVDKFVLEFKDSGLDTTAIEQCLQKYLPWGYQRQIPQISDAISQKTSKEVVTENRLSKPTMPSQVSIDNEGLLSIRVLSPGEQHINSSYRGVSIDKTIVPSKSCSQSMYIHQGIDLVCLMIKTLVTGRQILPIVFNNMNRLPLIEKNVDMRQDGIQIHTYRFNIRFSPNVNRIEIFSQERSEVKGLQSSENTRLVYVLILIKLKE